jgi:hypothetical protein
VPLRTFEWNLSARALSFLAMPSPCDDRGGPYRSIHLEAPREPWLERTGWRVESGFDALADGAIVAVHIAWADRVLATMHLTRDGDCDPWRAVGAATDDELHDAVRVRSGQALFVFADDASSRVEGPAGEISLGRLRDERLVTRMADDRYAIAMEPGVLYRTRRFGLTVTAEIVPRPAPLAAPKRGARIAVFVALCVVALVVGGAANALAEDTEPMLDAHVEHRDEDTLAHLLTEAAADAADRPMLPSEASRAAPTRRFIVSPFVRLCAGALGPFHLVDCFALSYPWPNEGDPEFIGGDEDSHSTEWGSRARGRMRVHSRWIEAHGSLSRRSIEQVVRRNSHRLARCTRNLATGTRTALVRFVIDRDGRVLAASVDAESRAAAVPSICVTDAIRAFHFEPPPDGGVVSVRYAVEWSRAG